MVRGVVLADVSPALGPMVVAALLLVTAGMAKLERPAPTALALARAGRRVPDGAVRGLGAVEVVAAVAALDAGVVGGAVVAVLYGGFAAFTARQVLQSRRTGEAADCGCFGDEPAPVGATHVAVNLAIAGAGLATAAVDAPGLRDAGFVAGLPVVAIAVVAAVGVHALLTTLPSVRALGRPGPTD